MGDDEAVEVKLDYLKEGQVEIKASVAKLDDRVRLEMLSLRETVAQEAKKNAVAIARINQDNQTKAGAVASIISGGALLITIIINFFT